MKLSVLAIFALQAASYAVYAQQHDSIATMQATSAESNQVTWGHWGPNPDAYSSWTTHSNRLVPIYTFGGNMRDFAGSHSLYRREQDLVQLYGKLPAKTLNPDAEYCDQSDVFRLQQRAVEAGKKRIILFVFDGMDWQTTQAAAIAKSGNVAYQSGRGTGLAFQDYQGAETDFAYCVTSPHNDGTATDVNAQRVTNPGGKLGGGYDPSRGGRTPWETTEDLQYLIAKNADGEKHAYTDSAASATSICSGIKTYNDAINVDYSGREVEPIARIAQAQGFAVGVVTSVPISHATPACAYANNVSRDDYQDLTRDLLGLPSVFHPGGLPGVDVLLGAGWGEEKKQDGAQGDNFVPGNRYLAADDQSRSSVDRGGKYVVAERTPGRLGSAVLDAAVKSAISGEHRLFGFFGVAGGHLPYQTADGGYDPVRSVGNPASARAEVYSEADVDENVSLGDMTLAAIEVLGARSDRWWLMVEAGDVDWANHANNIDNSIGALLSGDNAFQRTCQWIESHGGWQDTLLIVTADHGHYLVLDQPQMLAR
jgi:alkaline phosphatase